MSDEAVVHIVDDDEGLRQSLTFLLESVGIQALHYPDATAFLTEFDPDEPAIVIIDVRMPGMSGLQLQEELNERGYPAPVLFCSAHGDIPMSVRAVSRGAVDFLEKPYEPQRILEVVQRQQREACHRFAAHAARREVEQRVNLLTQREREVLRLVVEGVSSQTAANRLGTSVKTIDVHRARIKTKTGVDSLGVLVHDILTCGITV